MAGPLVKYDYKPPIPRGLDSDQETELLDMIAEFIKEQVLLYVGDADSPVKGKKFTPLKSKEYKAKKKREGLPPIPNMEENGDLLDALDTIVIDNKIRLTVSEDQQLKADNHNKFSAKSKKTPVPERRFIPNEKEGDVFKKPITDEIKKIIDDFVAEIMAENG